jgi:branched-chain amino acid transport system ATP-binding protein
VSLAVSGLVAGYGATTVLRCVDLVVPAGHVVALLGPNGSGKTTLLRACSGLLRPTAGTVTVDGADRTGQAPHDLVVAGVCHVPEGRAVFPGMTVAENLRLLAPPGTPDHVERAAEAFPVLGDKLDQIAGTLSGGEQQMLALTRAILREPRYILLDEVSMGLAPRVVEEIFAALRRLVERGSALLLVEQFVHMALALADLVYVMDRGRIGFRGEPVELDADALAAAYLAAGTPA